MISKGFRYPSSTICLSISSDFSLIMFSRSSKLREPWYSSSNSSSLLSSCSDKARMDWFLSIKQYYTIRKPEATLHVFLLCELGLKKIAEVHAEARKKSTVFPGGLLLSAPGSLCPVFCSWLYALSSTLISVRNTWRQEGDCSSKALFAGILKHGKGPTPPSWRRLCPVSWPCSRASWLPR